MKVSEHLAAMHTMMEGHHNQMIAVHESALKKADGMDDGDHDLKYHESAIRSHTQMANYHHESVEECQKAAASSRGAIYVEPISSRGGTGSDLNFGSLDGPRNTELRHSKAAGMDDAIVPDRVSGILTPIPRAGQREFQRTEVPLELEKMLALPDDEP